MVTMFGMRCSAWRALCTLAMAALLAFALVSVSFAAVPYSFSYLGTSTTQTGVWHNYRDGSDMPLPNIIRYYSRSTGGTRLLLGDLTTVRYDTLTRTVFYKASGFYQVNTSKRIVLIEAKLRQGVDGFGYFHLEAFAVTSTGAKSYSVFKFPREVRMGYTVIFWGTA